MDIFVVLMGNSSRAPNVYFHTWVMICNIALIILGPRRPVAVAIIVFSDGGK